MTQTKAASDDLEQASQGESEDNPLVETATDDGASARNAPSSGQAVNDFFSFSEIFSRVLATADDELDKSLPTLFWSGVAAGLALGLTFFARVLFTALTPGDESGLLGNLFYPIGFVLIVLGRYQLFTENTLTPVTLVLTRYASVPGLLKLWGVVFAANMLGAVAVAVLLETTQIFDAEQRRVALAMGREALDHTWWTIFFRALLAGWLVASMVWLIHGARDTISRLLLIWLIMYFVGAGHLFHVITGSVEIFFLGLAGELPSWAFIPGFIVPVTLGNIVGGVFLVAILGYAQLEKETYEGHGDRLSWREWLWGQDRQR